MEKFLRLEFIKQGYYKLYYPNGVYMGDLLCGDDGYYAWWPNHDKYGYISEHILLAIYNELHELNREWDQKIHSDSNI